MNTFILLMMCLVLFDLLGVFVCHEEVIANGLCFVSGLSFGYFLANLKKSCGLVKQFSDDLSFFVQNYNKNNINLQK